MTTVAGCPMGVCIINGEVVFFDLPWYICEVITNSDLDCTQPRVERTGEQNTDSDLYSDDREDSNPLFFTRR